jgi:hypothetical protein
MQEKVITLSLALFTCFVLSVALPRAATSPPVTTTAEVQASMSSVSYRIVAEVLAPGGREKGSTSYKMNDTLGQLSPIGLSESSNFRLYMGYWPSTDSTVHITAMQAT